MEMKLVNASAGRYNPPLQATWSGAFHKPMKVLLILGFIGVYIVLSTQRPLTQSVEPPCIDGLMSTSSHCPAQPVFFPTARPDITEANVKQLFTSHGFRNLSAARLSGAVQIPTMVYDDMGELGSDPRWDVFGTFAPYLERTFPNVHDKLQLTTINENGLLYEWRGSNRTLKPLLFMAHMDVVPVENETLDKWTFPPFSGHVDSDYIWGRGAEDDKSNLIAMLSAFEALLALDFQPSRTVILAIGFDEEGGGKQAYGAKGLSEFLLQKYGEDSMEIIFDEGIGGIEEHFGTQFAMPATAEKGYVDISVTVDMDGGHSSIPPDHTAIGRLAQIITAIEDNPFKSQLSAINPTTEYLSCIAAHGSEVPASLRNAIQDPRRINEVIAYMDNKLEQRALIRTSSAVDIIRGGIKINALPETANVLVNHRIAIESSVQTIKDYYTNITAQLAEKWHFDVCTFDGPCSGQTRPSPGKITLAAQYELEPSPITDANDVRFSWIAGTVRGVFGQDVMVAPVLLTGNTDTKWYWNLSGQIYRMSPWRAAWDPRGSRMHTVDERMPIRGLLEVITFYHELVRVVDEMRT